MTLIILLTTALTTGLSAGLLYGYSASVNGGLGKLHDLAYLSAMQSINRVILNPLFFIVFIGPVVLLPLATWLQYQQGARTSMLLFLAATLFYWAGTFAITAFGNVPLNQALARVDLEQASADELAEARKDFEIPWNRLHTMRTIAAAMAFGLLLLSFLI